MSYQSVARHRLLVETDWLADHLRDPALRVVDIRGLIKPPDAPKPWYLAQRDAYLSGHIPGAVFVDWITDIVEPAAPVQGTVAGPERFAALMGKLGIGDDSDVVVYDDNGAIAPRLWWALNYYGHAAVRLLDGGFPKWAAEKRPLESGQRTPAPATFTCRIQPGWRATVADVRSALADKKTTLVDCRSVKEFTGELGRGDRKGHIPTARHVPAVQLLAGDHRTWKDAAAIRALYEGAGVTADQPVITYCNAGVSASVGLFGLRLAGHPRAANFAGSWYEWERDAANPAATGD
jgi:thiosulfate/3-mercaptopyruvate sulfurtransferase